MKARKKTEQIIENAKQTTSLIPPPTPYKPHPPVRVKAGLKFGKQFPRYGRNIADAAGGDENSFCAGIESDLKGFCDKKSGNVGLPALA